MNNRIDEGFTQTLIFMMKKGYHLSFETYKFVVAISIPTYFIS